MKKLSVLTFVNLFVKNPQESGFFYRKVLEIDPIQESPTFVLFSLANGVMLGLWSLRTAQPEVQAQPGASEICFEDQEVDNRYKQWLQIGVTMAQKPTSMSFGRTFVALDPDGHRIRIYSPKESDE